MGLSHVQAKVLRTEGTELSQLRHLLRLLPAARLRTLPAPQRATGRKHNQLLQRATQHHSQQPRARTELQPDTVPHSRHPSSHSSRNNQALTSMEVLAQHLTALAMVLQQVVPPMGRPRGLRDKSVDRHSQAVLLGARVVPPSPLSQVHRRGPPVAMGVGTMDGVEEGPQGAWLDPMEVHLGRPREEVAQEAAATGDHRQEDMGVPVDMAVAKVGALTGCLTCCLPAPQACCKCKIDVSIARSVVHLALLNVHFALCACTVGIWQVKKLHLVVSHLLV